MPSQLKLDFPWLDVGKVAMAYEEGRGIEGEFIQSWAEMEIFFANTDVADIALPFIREIRQHGYDKTLRAGQSMWTLVLSRSRRHGLRGNQPLVAFSFSKDGTMNVRATLWQKSELINLTPRLDSNVEQLLQSLQSNAIE